jgi:Macrocin-O-methyltransferase (TylF)
MSASEPFSGPALDRPVNPHASAAELQARVDMAQLLENTPIPKEELPNNLALYLRRDVLADLLAMNELYLRILNLPGVVMEFGTRWGRHLALLVVLRELYEPYDYTRKVVGFDTFLGFPDVHEKDGQYHEIHRGSMAVPEGYDRHLSDVLEVHEKESVNAHIRRFEVIEGDARETLPMYLSTYPETIISLAYFDLDLYEPTKACLELIRPRLVPGSIVAFDEVAHRNFPGETIALLDTLDLPKTSMQKLRFSSYPTFVII